ncbi:MAG: hypothetical protein OIN66_15780 [Candidatus Methanoperedens sp.]|nr:hypothetical protein [Candidatus Methanoperedens sp.]
MDCCGPSKPKEIEKDVKDVKTGQLSNETNLPKDHTHDAHGGGCCGGGGTGMWLHLIVMFIVFIAIWYFSKG